MVSVHQPLALLPGGLVLEQPDDDVSVEEIIYLNASVGNAVFL